MKKDHKIKEPKIGQEIYVPSSIYLSHGLDDFEGGIAIISEIEKDKNFNEDDYNYLMVGIEENPGTFYNWKHLLSEQDKLKKRFKKSKAHPIPDDRWEMNMWD